MATRNNCLRRVWKLACYVYGLFCHIWSEQFYVYLHEVGIKRVEWFYKLVTGGPHI